MTGGGLTARRHSPRDRLTQVRDRITDAPWGSFVLRRMRRLVLSLWIVVTAAFLMIHAIPGDPVRAALGETAPEQMVEARREALGLNDPLWMQYVVYLWRLVRGDWGSSMLNDVPVSRIILDRLPATLEIALAAFAVTAVIAIPVGVAMAVLTRGGRRRRSEMAFTSASMAVDAVPNFVLAVIAVFVFGVGLSWLPVAGRGGLDSYVIPVIALAAGPAAVVARIMRVEILNVLQADYVRTARSKRIPPIRVYLRHALPNAATATLTVGGLMLGGLMTGTVLVENVLAWPGLGRMIVSSILSKDYPVVQGIVLVYGFAILVINTVVDLIIAVLDPRSSIRES